MLGRGAGIYKREAFSATATLMSGVRIIINIVVVVIIERGFGIILRTGQCTVYV